ncbi:MULTISPECIES: bifunctional adenosylcobinamide kinase/adenosylcobinamide-phosphate guanylyltransferase [Clostridium]|uniref:Adenosylcobinamide kinase n=1 Tax=Clostridium senegalense TaxID=1465809 RepID=A0A6M0H2E4_9CLOT|nr:MULTISPECIES: bifunctional adenosylcobinamide kinase/adenosylcobinamide-phosphate guanylyltransferase [Clostridium]NEU04779.1 bifunctional adenosylcobinamide kinase/adenosylcobinamide-phosphate guanylyltransferase [Clostridium senegalense]
MGKIVLVTGGSRSGKSGFAESLLKDTNDVLYIATAIVTDKEMESRINKHIERRNSKWNTYEGFKDLHIAVENSKEKNILLDCITIMVTNLMFNEKTNFDDLSLEEADHIEELIKAQVEKLIVKAKECNKNLIMVTNEVGSGLIPEYKLSRIYRDIAGSINQFIAKLCDEVYFVACGLPLKLK